MKTYDNQHRSPPIGTPIAPSLVVKPSLVNHGHSWRLKPQGYCVRPNINVDRLISASVVCNSEAMKWYPTEFGTSEVES
jgi:hypothetical protein